MVGKYFMIKIETQSLEGSKLSSADVSSWVGTALMRLMIVGINCVVNGYFP